MENIIKGNPLMQPSADKPADFKVKRRLLDILLILFLVIAIVGLNS